MPGLRLSIFLDLLMGKNIKITKASQLATLKTETFIAGVILAILFLLITWAVITFLVAYEGGKEDKSGGKRRIIFYVVGFINIVILFVINTFHVSGFVKRSLQSDYTTTNIIAIVICALVYFVGGFALSKIFKTAKIGTLFPSRK